ncbi:uncharacterized protein LOC131885082 [Tigriopus californicus]|uniref:uncharacterized protein LOC131885082 n=1 Tax=Tigriopus californicus TaxID=6832 RepID=UPI0027DA590D|nr:uncharacterized protein LOC131885082 [Tigriopus californicus]
MHTSHCALVAVPQKSKHCSENSSPVMKSFHVLLILFVWFETILCYCWQPGKNPSFQEKPRVEQIAYDQVRVSWYGLVDRIECVDQFLVKHWMASDPQTATLTEFLPNWQFETTIDVIPRVVYEFQAVAREDKGTYLGVDYNRSPVSRFQTSRHKINVEPTVPPGFETRIDLTEDEEEESEADSSTEKYQSEGFQKRHVDLHSPLIIIGLCFLAVCAIMTTVAVAMNYCQRTSEDD